MGIELHSTVSDKPKKVKLSKAGIIIVAAVIILAVSLIIGISSSKAKNAPIISAVDRCVAVTQNNILAHSIDDSKLNDYIKDINREKNVEKKAAIAQEMISYAAVVFEDEPTAEDEITGAGNRLFVELKNAGKKVLK